MTPARLAPEMTLADIARNLLLLRASETLSATVTTADVVGVVGQLRGAGLDATHLQVALAGGRSDPLAERTIRERRAFYFTDGAELAAAFPTGAKPDLHAAACVPLVGTAGILGALQVVWDAPRTFYIAERAVIATLAAYVAQALERAQRLDARIGVADTLQEAIRSRLPLRRLDAANHSLGEPIIATAVVAVIDTAGGGAYRLRWSNAGHPPPVVVHPDGTVQSLTGNDLLLGARRFARRRTWTAPLAGGSTVLLHTDGLVERSSGAVDDGTASLHRRLRTARRTRLPDLLEDAVADIGADRTDDIAMLAVRLPPDGSPGSERRRGGPG